MSTNGINSCEDTEMAECDGEKVVTMMDVLKEQEDFEDDANAVLGASDDKNCTYSKGYIKRQAIYACMTCCADAKDDPTKRAGVCLACSLTCHENHDLVELYTKRNFRCDCGNPKFNSHPCQFTPEKKELNEDNVYNQNFSGVYCICHRPYPDPESPTEQEMIQCVICEDWLHSSHLEAVVPPNELYSEMICKACMDRNEFLHDYSELVVNKEDGDVDILNTTSELNETPKVNGNVDSDMLVDENIDSNAKTEKLKSDSSHDKPVTTTDVDANVESTVTEESKEKEQSDTNTDCNTEKLQEDSDIQPNTETKEISEKNSDSDVVKEKVVTEETEETLESSTAKSTLGTESKDNPSEEITPTSENTDNQNDEKPTEETNLSETSEKTLDSKNDEHSEGVTPTTEPSVPSAEEAEETVPMETSDISKPVEQNVTPMETKENPDSRTQEQVEEDLLLADPMEASSAENKSNDTTPSESTTTSGELIKENESKSQSMDVNESENTTANVEKEQQKEEISSSDSELPKQEQSGSNDVENTADDKLNETENEEKTIETNVTKNNENITDNANAIENEIKDTSDLEIKNNDVKDTSDGDVETATAENHKRKLSSEADSEDCTTKKPKLQCIRPKGVKKIYKGATFWPSNFRNKLCTCNECISMYKDLSVLFLTDPDDTVTAYERLGKEKTNGEPVTQYEKGMAALSSLGHVQQINALTEYGKMRDKLLEFLKSFKERKVIVKEEDIKAFFAGMKPVREPDGVYFCR